MISLEQFKAFLQPFEGATPDGNGKKGLVPQPKSNEYGEFYLNSNGSWKELEREEEATDAKDSEKIATVGWVNDELRSTNVMHRTGAETIPGDKTFSGNNVFYGNNDFTGNTTANIAGETAATDSRVIATTGWANDPEKATNIVHRSGTETITGDKTVSGVSTFSGSITSLGNNTFSGTNGFSNTTTFSGNITSNGTNTFNGTSNFTGTNSIVNVKTQAVSDNSTKAVNTAFIANKFQIVSALPASPDANTFYFITES